MFSTAIKAMSSKSSITRPLLRDLHAFWFEGVPKSHEQSLSPETFKRWFSVDPKLDEMCKEKYGAAVEEAAGMSLEEIDKVVEGTEDAVGVILLLDQLPRNIYRGKEASKVYNVYDPKAATLAKRYLQDQGLGQRDKTDHFARSMFLYLPLMHSEDLSDHKLFAELLDKRTAECTTDSERKGVEMVRGFEDKHRKVLEKFGRYPSRNECLGRESTAEELELLKDGPGW